MAKLDRGMQINLATIWRIVRLYVCLFSPWTCFIPSRYFVASLDHLSMLDIFNKLEDSRIRQTVVDFTCIWRITDYVLLQLTTILQVTLKLYFSYVKVVKQEFNPPFSAFFYEFILRRSLRWWCSCNHFKCGCSITPRSAGQYFDSSLLAYLWMKPIQFRVFQD